MCKLVGLTMEDMQMMTVGMCLDYIDNYVEQKDPKKKAKPRRATQEQFDAFHSMKM